jgi:hypothetical protein
MMVENSRTFMYCFERKKMFISSQFVKKRKKEEIKLTYNCCVK